MSGGPQGHSGQRLSISILLFMLDCVFYLCAAQHWAEGKGFTCLSICNSCMFWNFYLTMQSQFVLWSLWEPTVAGVGIASKEEEFIFPFFCPVQLFKGEGLLYFFPPQNLNPVLIVLNFFLFCVSQLLSQIGLCKVRKCFTDFFGAS